MLHARYVQHWHYLLVRYVGICSSRPDAGHVSVASITASYRWTLQRPTARHGVTSYVIQRPFDMSGHFARVTPALLCCATLDDGPRRSVASRFPRCE